MSWALAQVRTALEALAAALGVNLLRAARLAARVPGVLERPAEEAGSKVGIGHRVPGAMDQAQRAGASRLTEALYRVAGRDPAAYAASDAGASH